MAYLCDLHKKWLQDNPLAANHHYHESMETAIELLESGRHQQALNYLGAAHETAETLLQNELMFDKFLSEFGSSLVIFSASLLRLGQFNAARMALQNGLARYEMLLNTGTSTPNQKRRLLEQYENLHRGVHHCELMQSLAKHDSSLTDNGADYEATTMAQQSHSSYH